MKIMTFFISLLAVLCSCTHTHIATKKDVGSAIIKLHEGDWYFNFKNEVFIKCLKKIYPQRLGVLIDSLDASSAANIDWLDYNQVVLKIADSLASDFAKRPEAILDIENRKVTMNVCISYRNSAELDSIAVTFYRKFHPKQ